MKKCEQCQVTIIDDTKTCPLCGRILHQGDIKMSKKSMYPDVDFDVGKFNFYLKLFLFILIIVAIVLCVINYYTYNGFVWSIIAIGTIIYFAVTIVYSIMHHANLASKIVVQTIGAQILMVVIDNVLGYRGWSVNYAIPGMILIANVAMEFLIIVNRMNWQSYFMYQLAITIFSFIPIIMWAAGLLTEPILAIVTSSISLLILVGSIVLGDKSVKNELKRRFHF